MSRRRGGGFGDVTPDRWRQTPYGQQYQLNPRGVRVGAPLPNPGISQGPGPPEARMDQWYQPGVKRQVRHTQHFWLNQTVPFTGTPGEQVQGRTVVVQFPLLIRGAWTGLAGARVRFSSNNSGFALSSLPTQLRTYAGNSNLVYPTWWWRKPYWLQPNTSLVGDYLNDGGEEENQVVFHCERPDNDEIIEVQSTSEYRLLLDLGLDGAAGSITTAKTQQIANPLLIYGMLSTATDITVRFLDSAENFQWSQEQLPIGAFAGIDLQGTSDNVQPIVEWPTPYYLAANSQIYAEITNVGAETGGYITFLCERIMFP